VVSDKWCVVLKDSHKQMGLPVSGKQRHLLKPRIDTPPPTTQTPTLPPTQSQTQPVTHCPRILLVAVLAVMPLFQPLTLMRLAADTTSAPVLGR
jgi:hypothetical protein